MSADKGISLLSRAEFTLASGIDILPKEGPFGKGIFGVLQGRISGFWRENSKLSRFHEKTEHILLLRP